MIIITWPWLLGPHQATEWRKQRSQNRGNRERATRNGEKPWWKAFSVGNLKRVLKFMQCNKKELKVKESLWKCNVGVYSISVCRFRSNEDSTNAHWFWFGFLLPLSVSNVCLNPPSRTFVYRINTEKNMVPVFL